MARKASHDVGEPYTLTFVIVHPNSRMDAYQYVWKRMDTYGAVWSRMENNRVWIRMENSLTHWYCSWWTLSCQCNLPLLLYMFWTAGSGPIEHISCHDLYGSVWNRMGKSTNPYGSVWHLRMELNLVWVRMGAYGCVSDTHPYASIRKWTK